ncbi:16S rRNA (cytidine(1402)-2'-O)-methyltransferase [Marinicella litoralis]|uniref:Ribosomal RNA small subunit methyltransferase I n=1 Tax=Marinicella litoralis TaxID=644220 RepID=A0A4R6XWF0_9GAMM|nr:16S rRNA (cytidine(1402)-2'-O)-methyltransferase [Marinicella litoralis]TDR20818.1 16S rRNA (cytidine1402-2'-O)-methyltransferase [Marinicella litoralis]
MNHSSDINTGTLFVVATPIGNLKDITLRAIETLKACQWVACEDTRHSQRLFQEYGIKTKTLALHQHNENHSSQQIISLLQNGENVALVSDAGTPLISDPGYPLVQLAHENNITVSPIPGPSALIALLSAAAINTQPFVFHGFLPPKKQQRLHFYQSLLPLNSTHVFYESSHRIADSIQQLAHVLGENTTLVMGRELTKRFEHIFRGTAAELVTLIENDPNQQKGEFVIALQGIKQANSDQLSLPQQKLAVELNQHLPPKVAAKLVAEHYDINKKQVYEFILSESSK